jgi:hypothetical protein
VRILERIIVPEIYGNTYKLENLYARTIMSSVSFPRSLLVAGAILAWAPGMAAAADTAVIHALFPTAITNLALALTVVLLGVFGLYAYASLARLAPYHTWIYLYLVSFTGIVWALFLVENGGSLSDALFVFTTIAGINLIVHILHFDRVVIPLRAGTGYDTALPQETEPPSPIEEFIFNHRL